MKKLFFTLTLLTIFSNILFAQSYDDVYSNSNSEWNASKYDYVNDYVDNQNDDSYFYASRIRRFYRPMRSCGYYSNFYRDPYWWDWSYSYPSWYMTIPSLNFSWNNWVFSFGYTNWNNGWYGNNWGYGNGWNNGWNNGWYGNNWNNGWGYGNGWNNGWGYGNGWNNGYRNSGYSGGRTYKYGPRSSVNSTNRNVGIDRPQRDRVMQLKDNTNSMPVTNRVNSLDDVRRNNISTDREMNQNNVDRNNRFQRGTERQNNNRFNVETQRNYQPSENTTRQERRVEQRQFQRVEPQRSEPRYQAPVRQEPRYQAPVRQEPRRYESPRSNSPASTPSVGVGRRR